MLLKIKESKGFSLVEALVATAITGIGFTAVYSIVVVSEQFTQRSVAKHKMQLVADQVLEVIESDIENIDSYSIDLSNCVAPTDSQNWNVRGYQWCKRLEDELGAAGADNERNISVSDLDDDRKLVTIIIESFDGRSSIIVKRIFDV